MKKTIIYVMILFIAILSSGCTARNAEGINIVNTSTKESNSKVKAYYEDRTENVIRENLSAMALFLNNNDLKPKYIQTNTTSEKNDFSTYESAVTKKLNTENFSFNIKCHTDFTTTSNYITIDKTYNNRNDAYFDLSNIFFAIQTAYDKDETLKDKFGLGYIIIDEKMLDNKILRFTIYKEKAYRFISEKARKQFLESGFQVVNTPQEADKIYYFELTRDYKKSEMKKMKDEGKGINFGVISAGQDNTMIMNSSMNYASRTNNTSTSLGVAAGTGIAFSIVGGIFESMVDSATVIPSMKVINNTTKEEYIQTFNTGFSKYELPEESIFLMSMRIRVSEDKPYDRINIK